MDDNQILDQREEIARQAIIAGYGTEAGEYGPTLFAQHHLQEVDNDTWMSIFGIEKPEPTHILQGLVLVGSWSSGATDDLDMLDFSLPDGATQYVLSVRFEAGEVAQISMEG